MTSNSLPKSQELYERVLHRFVQSMEATRDFADSIRPMIRTLADQRNAARDKKFQRQVKEALEPLSNTARTSVGRDVARVASMLTKGVEGPVKLSSDASSLVVGALMDRVYGVRTEAEHQTLLNRSVLVTLVTHWEVLVSDLVHARYELHPRALDPKTTITVAELRELTTTEEAITQVVSQKVDGLLRGSSDEWLKYFEVDAHVDLAGVFADRDLWNEIVQRRHLIVHTGGRVSPAYLQEGALDTTLSRSSCSHCRNVAGCDG